MSTETFTEVFYPMGFAFSDEVQNPDELSREELAEQFHDHVYDWVMYGPMPDLDSLIVTKPNEHVFMVKVSGCTTEQATQVLSERINHDEDYGFEYTIEVV